MPSSDPSSHDQDRIRAVEEEVGLNELRTGKLDEMVRELSSEVFELARRMETLERRLADLSSASSRDVPDEPPPHSHRK